MRWGKVFQQEPTFKRAGRLTRQARRQGHPSRFWPTSIEAQAMAGGHVPRALRFAWTRAMLSLEESARSKIRARGAWTSIDFLMKLFWPGPRRSVKAVRAACPGLKFTRQEFPEASCSVRGLFRVPECML